MASTLVYGIRCHSCKQVQYVCRFITTSQKKHKGTVKNLKGKSPGAKKWLTNQLKDPYVKRAKLENWRCRSAFKLLEIDEKHKILKPGNVVIDCGAAPGSWCQVAAIKVNATEKDPSQPTGIVIGVDLLHIEPLDNVSFFPNSDFTNKDVQQSILGSLGGKKVHVVLSDMAPRASDARQLDHELSVELCASVLRFSVGVLKHGGHLLCKLWMGPEQNKLHAALDKMFTNVKVVKPPASRTSSSEIYFLAKNFKGVPSDKIKSVENARPENSNKNDIG
ncbi:rRNA methyltransferase 2, mitochondrial-like [Mizuhopecten yessoensis]|uniref:rRNA methyltransferase 2, mitochondrial n=1 Tax=Mizuhopecten yessoensis TaxID=6573 RepID=A0A210PM00_MIZYE|nr:rRNA methyltransferase 2, mitochondrial-like [Mizuhopecten yessoensis]OWF37519.1 ribosomal RNA methyltransferase 2 [Mizuhopecten yessoensis]